MAKKKKKVEPIVPVVPELTEGQYYWCVNCGHHGDFGFHRKKSVKCELCTYESISIWTLEEINDPHMDTLWIERFLTKKVAVREKEAEKEGLTLSTPEEKKTMTDSKKLLKDLDKKYGPVKTKDKSLKKKLEAIKQMGKK